MGKRDLFLTCIFLFYMLFNVIFKLQYSNNFLYMAI